MKQKKQIKAPQPKLEYSQESGKFSITGLEMAQVQAIMTLVNNARDYCDTPECGEAIAEGGMFDITSVGVIVLEGEDVEALKTLDIEL